MWTQCFFGKVSVQCIVDVSAKKHRVQSNKIAFEMTKFAQTVTTHDCIVSFWRVEGHKKSLRKVSVPGHFWDWVEQVESLLLFGALCCAIVFTSLRFWRRVFPGDNLSDNKPWSWESKRSQRTLPGSGRSHTVQGEYRFALKMLILVYCEEKLTSGLGMMTLRAPWGASHFCNYCVGKLLLLYPM
jgi:hypothetical protein